MKKAIVTGGAGFIGSHVVDALIAEGYVVSVVDSLVAGKRERVHPDADFHKTDICDHEALTPIMQGADVVFHLAALPSVQYSIEHPEETNAVNIGGTLSVLNAAHKAGVRRVVYSASSSAYGNQETMPLVENLPAEPLSPYALQKYVGELYARLFSNIYGLETVSLRYFNVYGPRLDPEGPYALVIGRFLKQRSEGASLTVTGDGEQTRDFTYVSDIARGNLLAAVSDKVGKGEIINLGAGQSMSINALAKMIGGEVKHIESRIEPKHTHAAITLAKDLLGWEPKIKFEQGLAELKNEFGI